MWINCLLFLFLASLIVKGTSAYRIDGSGWESRNLVYGESGTSETEAGWHGSDGADLDAYAWGQGSSSYATAVWRYDLGYCSGDISVTWCYHIRCEFSVTADAFAYAIFWFELWDSDGRVGSSGTRSYDEDVNSDGVLSKSFSSLRYSRYRSVVYAGVRAASDASGSSAEADAYHGPLQVTTKYLNIH